MKLHLLLPILLFINNLAIGQIIFCGSPQAPANPALQPLHEQLEQQALEFFQAHIQDVPDVNNSVLTIPVVVHIIHDNGPENISDAQVQQGIAWLNAAYANSDYFDQGSGTDVGIQFCLAQRTPNSLTTNGITRNQSPLTNVTLETQDASLKNLNRWEPKQYLNIWLVRDICSTSAGCGVVGYAYRPEYHGTSLDGLVIEAQFFGAVQSQMSVAAHELGHYLGLYHTFEGGCTNNNCLVDGDRICDTPPDQSTAAVDCGQLVNTCSTDVQSGLTTDQPDMTSNFLDYGNINCFHDFTPGQAARMNFYLNGIRHSLLNSKGCLPPCTTPVVSAFIPSATTINPGETISFTNGSQNANAYQWSVNSIPFSTAANPGYTFATPGTYTITLLAQASNGALCDAASSQVVIQVVCNVVTSFTVSNQSPAANEVVTLTNTSQNATVFSWTVNGVAQNDTLTTLTFTTAGVYAIQLTASNGICQNSVQQEVFVRDSCADQTFQMQYGHGTTDISGYSVATLASGNLIFIGGNYIEVDSTYRQFYLVKMKPDGTQLWRKTIDPSLYDSNCNAIAATSDGGFVIGLESNDFLHTPVIKLNADGVVEWAQGLTTSSNSQKIIDIKVNTNQELLVLGANYDDIITQPFFAKFGPSGNLLWAKSFSSPVTAHTWGKIVALPDGGLITTDGYNLIRFDTDGNLLWRKHMPFVTNIYDIVVGSDQAVYCCGVNNGIWLIKLTMDGQIIWSKSYRHPDFTISLQRIVFANGGLTLAGSSVQYFIGSASLSRGLLMRFDTAGTILWNRNYLQNIGSKFNDLTSTGGGYFITGDISVDEFYNKGAWLLKTDGVGFAGTCTPISVPLQTFVNSNHTENQPLPFIVNRDFTSASLSLIDLNGTPTLLCEKACPTNPEICNNNLDDDGDGLFDCLDPECPCTEDVCQPKRNNHWYFGNHTGLDFSTEPPTPRTDGQTVTEIAAATISDAQGNLLFYTDGQQIFNRFHQPMPHGTNPYFSAQGVLGPASIIVPHPDSAAIYYVFMVEHPNNFSYARIDMRLDNGKGDVDETTGFAILDSGIIYSIAATRSCTFNGYWVAVQQAFTAQMLAYRIDQHGLHVDPVVSPAGDTQFTIQMKFSPQGKQLARAIPGDSLVIYSFDPDFTQSGQFTAPQRFKTSDLPLSARGVEYSPSGRYLYLSMDDFNGIKGLIYQFDLEAGSTAAIAHSKTAIAQVLADYLLQMQLGPDGKIYVANASATPSLDIILQPDAPGLACQYQHAGLLLDPTAHYTFGLVNSIASDFRQPHLAFSPDAVDSICTLNTPTTYRLKNVACDVDSIHWALTGLAGNIVSNYQYANVTYTTPGQGQLIATAFTACGTATDTLAITVHAPFNKILNLGPDRTVCDNGVFTFNAGSGFAHYRWQDGSTDSVLTTLLPGKYWVDVYDACGNRQTDTVIVRIASASVLELGPDFIQCSGIPKTFSRPAFFAAWHWSPATSLSCDTCSSITVDPATTATWTIIAQTANGCLSIDTLYWQIVDTLFYARDTAVCVGQTINFYGVALPADTTASFLRPSSGPGCDSLITVQVLGIETPTTTLQTRICADQFFNFQGTLLPADTTAIFHLPGVGCDSVVTVEVQSFPLLSVVLPADTSLSIGASLTLTAVANGTGLLSFQWQPGVDLSCTDCLQPVASPLDTITYVLQVTDGQGCVVRDSITLRVDPDCRLIIPNAFTPNGDAVNDWFYPQAFPCVRTVRLWRVLNRWGVVMFERRNFAPNEQDLGWDGRYQGKEAPSDVLVWQAELEYFDGRVEQRKGEITLLR